MTWIKRPREPPGKLQPVLDSKQLEGTSYLVALRNFARELGIEEDVAAEVYERELRKLATDPKVTRFLGVIAHKHTRDALRSLGSRRERGAGRG